MSIKNFIQQLQQRVQRLRKMIQQSQQGRLRVMNLEDRRLLDATAGFLAGQLLLDGFDAGDSLSISSHADNHLDFELTNGTWSSVSDAGLSLLNGNQTLRVDSASVADLQQLGINAAGANLNAVTSAAALNLQQLQINNGGHIQLSDTVVSRSMNLVGDQITDAADSNIRVSGLASLSADSITLGDDGADETHFGSVTFVSTGAVSITEDSATEIAGTNSAGSLTLTSSGALTNADGSSLNVSGSANFSGTSIAVDDSGSASANFGNLTFTSSGSVQIVEASDLHIAANSSGTSVSLSAEGNTTTAAGVKVTAESVSLVASESVASAGEIGSFSQGFSFQADSLQTQSDGDQFLASDGSVQFSTLNATDSSAAFDAAGGSATVHLSSGEFRSSSGSITGGLDVAAGVELQSSGSLVDADLSATSKVTFGIESTAAATGASVTGFDQWTVSGTPTLAGAELLIADENLLAHGTKVKLIDNNGTAVSGTFSGLAEGATVTGSSGQRYQISYVGGDGNDVELTALTSTFAFSQTTDSVAENVASSQKVISVTRSGDTSTADSVSVSVAGVTATAGTDFGSATTLTANFAAGATSTTIIVAITNDETVEADETLKLTLNAPTDSLISTTANENLVTISNDDVTELKFAVTPTSIGEGDSGTTTFTVDVTSSKAVDGSFQVAISAIDGTALAASDFSLTTSSLSFAGTAGESQTVSVNVTGETTFEANETFELKLGAVSASQADIVEATSFTVGANHQVTITNDDTPGLALLNAGSLTISDQTVSGADNQWVLSFDSATSEVVLSSNQADLGTGTATASSQLRFAASSITGEIRIEGNGGDDLLTVDYRNGNPIPGGSLVFVGGSQSGGQGDGLAVIGDGLLNATYTPDAMTFGNGQVVVGSNTLKFEGLEPVDISGFATATLTLPGAADLLTVVDGTDFFSGGTQEALRVSGSSAGVNIETAAFWNNNQLVIDTVAGGVDGADQITITSASSDHSNTSVRINTGNTVGDVVRLNGNVEVDGSLEITSRSIALDTASVSSGTNQTYTGAVTLQQATALTGSTVTFAGTVDSEAGENNALSVTGNAALNGNVGSTQALSALQVSGTTLLAANVTTVSQQSYSGAVTLGANAVLSSTSNGNLQFGSTLDGAFSLNLNTAGTNTFSGVVGGTNALASITTNAGGATTVSGGSVTTTGIQNYQDSVVLTSATNLTGSEVQLRGGAGGNQALTITGGLNLQSNINQVSTLNVTGTTVLNGNVTSTGQQDYRDSVTLQGNAVLIGNGIRFHDTVDGNFLLTANSGTAALQFDEAAGATTALSGINATGNSVVFSGNVSVDDEGLNVSSTTTTNVSGNVTSTNSGSATFNNTGVLTLSNSSSLQLDGAFSQTGAGTVQSGADISTTGDAISFASTVTQTAAIALRTTASGNAAGANVTLNQLNSAGLNVTINGGSAGSVSAGSITNAGQLTVEDSGSSTFTGAVSSNSIVLSDTTGAIQFQADVTTGSLTTTANSYSVQLLEDSSVTNAVTFANTGGVTFGNGTDDVQTFQGGVQSTASTTTVQGTVATTNDSLTLGQTNLAATTVLQTGSGAGNITVGQIAGAGIQLTANAGTGAIDLSNSANVIGNLQLIGGSATVAEADDVTQSAAWNLTRATSVSAGTNDIVLTNAANQFGDVTLAAGNVRLTEQTDLTVTNVNATSAVQLSSAGSINDAENDSVTDITAASVQLTAGSGIGNSAALELATTSITASTTNGNLSLSNSSATATTVQSLTTGTGAIDFQQSGGGAVTVQSASSTTGNIQLAAASGNLTIGNAVTASNGTVTVTTTTSGDVLLEGVVTATNNVASIISAGSIQGDASNTSADVVANQLNLTAAGGIGTVSPLETSVNQLTVANTGAAGTVISNGSALSLGATSVASDFQLCVAVGDLTVAGTLNAAGHDVRLQADAGQVRQTSAGVIQANLLGVNAATGIDLDVASNDVDSLAATSATGNVQFSDSDGFAVSTATASGCFDGAVGITSFGAGTIDLNSAAGTISVSEVVTSVNGNVSIESTDGNVSVSANVTSTSGGLNVTGNSVQQTAQLSTAGSGTISVTADQGDLTMSAAAVTNSASGAITLAATGNVEIASVTSTSGQLNVTADSDGDFSGAITDSNGAAVNLQTSGNTILSAGSGIDVDTNLPTLTAGVSGTGDLSVTETNDLVLQSAVTANGSITVLSGGALTATSVQAGVDAADNVSLTATTGTLTATRVISSGNINLQTDAGVITATDVQSTRGNVSISATGGNVNLDSVSATAAAATVNIVSTGQIVDINGSALNVSVTSGTATLSGTSIGMAGTNVFKPTTADPIEISAGTLNATATGSSPDGIIAIHLTSDTTVGTLTGDVVFLTSAADVNLSSATTTANSLSVVSSEDIILPSVLTVANDLRIQGATVSSVPGPVIELNATRILFVSGAAAELQITASEFDGRTNGNLTVSSDSANLRLTDLNCDLSAIHTGSFAATLNQTTGGTITQQLPADTDQNSKIQSDSLLLTGSGTFALSNLDNDVATLAANTSGAITYADANDLAIGSVNGTDGIEATGNNHVLLDVGGNLALQQQLNAGTADVRITSGRNGGSGTITQSSSGAITANQLGVRNDGAGGHMVLAADNDVNTLAAANNAADGQIVFHDTDEISIGSVAAASLPDASFAATTGIQTNNGDVTIAGGLPGTGTTSVGLNQAVTAGTATVRILAEGDVVQSADGTISANALGVRQLHSTGNVVLDDANQVSTLAIQNVAAAGTVGFNNHQPLTIGSVSPSSHPAEPTLVAVQFDQTNGVATSNGTVQIHVDGPAAADGSLQINQAVNSGSADVALRTDGSINQSAAGSLTAADLLMQQTAETAGQSVMLGAALNDVDNLAIRNVSEGGDVFFNDTDDLTVSSVTVSDVGALSTTAANGIQADAADINITSTGNLNVTEDIDAASDSSTSPIDEIITLISRDGNFTLSDGTTISTDEDPTAGSFVDNTGDRIHILAGVNGTAGIVDLGDPSTVEVRTDGGVAKQIAPRPSGFTAAPSSGVESAFVTLTDAENSRQNLTFQDDGFLGELQYIFGVAGEENLEVVVDWGVITLVDPTFNGVAGDAVLQGTGEYEFSDADRDKSIFYIDQGGEEYRIAHLYRPADLVTTTNDRNGRQNNPNIIGVRFSVAQHESINIWGNGAVNPDAPATVETAAAFTGTAATITDASGNPIAPTSAGLALLSSTDTNDLRNIQAEASSQFPLANQVTTPTGRPEGLAEWEFIAGPTPGVILFQPTERFVAEPPEVVAPVEALVVSQISGDAFFGDGAASDGGVGTDVYLQIRRYFEVDAEAEVVIARINDSDLLASREAFEEFVEGNSILQDGAGYEVWLITETGGQRVERPVVQFEVTGGRPGPATEALPEAGQIERLIDVEFRQADEPSSEEMSSEDAASDQQPIQGSSKPADAAQRPPIDPTGADAGIGPAGNDQDNKEDRPADNGSAESQSSFGNESSESLLAEEELAPQDLGQNAKTTTSESTELPRENVVESTPAGLSESVASAGVAVTSYSAVSRFRSARSAKKSDLSTSARTINAIRRKSPNPTT